MDFEVPSLCFETWLHLSAIIVILLILPSSPLIHCHCVFLFRLWLELLDLCHSLFSCRLTSRSSALSLGSSICLKCGAGNWSNVSLLPLKRHCQSLPPPPTSCTPIQIYLHATITTATTLKVHWATESSELLFIFSCLSLFESTMVLQLNCAWHWAGSEYLMCSSAPRSASC